MARFDFATAGDMALGNSLGETLFQHGVAASNGRDGAPDLVSAHKWFNLAAMQGNDEAVLLRHDIALEMSAAEIAAAQRAAREWLRAR